MCHTDLYVPHPAAGLLHLSGSVGPQSPLRKSAEAPLSWVFAAPQQVIAVCKSADLLLMVLDATKPWYHKEILTRELESVGMRLNR